MQFLDACGLTVLVETVFFAVLGYGKVKGFLSICVLANIATNLSMNLLLGLLPKHIPLIVYAVFEIAVVLLEYFIYKRYLDGKGNGKLILSTICANALSVGIGLILGI